MDERRIEVKCQGARMAPLESLVVIQGNLKELSSENAGKLRRRIEQYGFDAPLFVWQNKILDGTQRARVLKDMVADGWELPDGLVPVCDIQAENEEEAKRRLLGYVSQYGHVNDEGLFAFVREMEDSGFDSLDLPNMDMEQFQKDYLTKPGTPGSGNPGEGRPETLKPYEKVHVLLSFPAEVYAEAEDLIDNLKMMSGVEHEQGES